MIICLTLLRIVSGRFPDAGKKKHIMKLVIALVLASAPAHAFSPYVPVTDGPTVAPTSCETTFTKVDPPTDAPGALDCYEACSEAGLKMPCITSAAVNEQLWLQVQEDGGGYLVWLGYTDVANEGNFVWEDGCTSEYTNWYSDQPDDLLGPGADYAYMGYASSGAWADWKSECQVAGTCSCWCQDACGYSS